MTHQFTDHPWQVKAGFRPNPVRAIEIEATHSQFRLGEIPVIFRFQRGNQLNATLTMKQLGHLFDHLWDWGEGIIDAPWECFPLLDPTDGKMGWDIYRYL